MTDEEIAKLQQDAVANGLVEIRSQTVSIRVEGVDIRFTVTFPQPIRDPALLPNISVTADRSTPFTVEDLGAGVRG